MRRKEKVTRTDALHGLKDLVREAGIRLNDEEPKRQEREILPSADSASPERDDEVFEQAMEGIARPLWKHNIAASPEPEPIPASGPELEGEQIMKQAIDGELAGMVQEHPEYIEGWVGVLGRRYLPNLRNGMYSIQGQLDLHGLNRIEARTVVEDFIGRMSKFSSCCVKIIHGRGINSRADRAVLKENLQRWLSSRRMSRYVVAYASAPLNDGGVGAVYVLLRRA